MSEFVKVESIAELRAFRVAMVKFVDACNVALGDAESDMQRTYNWVERDQLAFWNGQLVKRTEALNRAKEALRMKKLYKSPTGGEQSAIDEERAARAAVKMLEEAQQKIIACKQWARRLQKEIMLYKGGVTRFTSLLGGDIPRALAKLDAMASSLEAYATLTPDAVGSAPLQGGFSSMTRPADEIRLPRFAPIDIAALRESFPSPEARAGAPENDIRGEAWKLPELSADTRRGISDLKLSAERIDPDSHLLMTRNAWSGTEVFFERRRSEFPKDAGWYISSTDVGGIVAMNKVLVRDLLEVRPDFSELLSLPHGYLALVDANGVRSIFSPTGEDLWADFRAKNAGNVETA